MAKSALSAALGNITALASSLNFTGACTVTQVVQNLKFFETTNAWENCSAALVQSNPFPASSIIPLLTSNGSDTLRASYCHESNGCIANMIEISNNLADCIMPNNGRRLNYYEVTASWTKQFCQVLFERTETPSSPFSMAPSSSPNEPTFKPTISPSHSFTPSPPLPTFSSNCVASKCDADFVACMKTFDNCACFPGQLSCVKTFCQLDWDSSLKICNKAIPLAKTCMLTCAAGTYPNNALIEGSTVVMTVVASIELSGLSVDEFKKSEVSFKSALASTLACLVDQINITKVTEVSFRRLLVSKSILPVEGSIHTSSKSERQLQKVGDSYLDIQFEITASSATDMNAIAATLQGTRRYFHFNF
jgi:hypothetical protein